MARQHSIAAIGGRNDQDAAKPCILVAEDNLLTRRLLARLFARLNQEATIVENGQQALDAWRTGRFTHLLTDCQMPIMDGLWLVQTIREYECGSPRPRTRIVAMSSDPDADLIQRSIAAGVDGFLPKPVSIQMLGNLLRRFSSSPGLSQNTRALARLG